MEFALEFIKENNEITDFPFSLPVLFVHFAFDLTTQKPSRTVLGIILENNTKSNIYNNFSRFFEFFKFVKDELDQCWTYERRTLPKLDL